MQAPIVQAEKKMYICKKEECDMPKIYEYFGFIFYFYSNEHEPIHVHVIHNQNETIFELIIEDGSLVKINRRNKKGKNPLTEKDADVAEKFINKYSSGIVTKWINFFVLKKQVRATTIKKKI